MRLPEPPGVLRAAAVAWRGTALALGLALALVCLRLGPARDRLRGILAERAGAGEADTVGTAMTILLFGGLVLWAVLAALALLVGRGTARPRVLPRALGAVLLLVLAVVLPLTGVTVASGSGLGLVVRGLLTLSGLCALLGAVLGLLPPAWSWIRTNRDRPADRRGSASARRRAAAPAGD